MTQPPPPPPVGSSLSRIHDDTQDTPHWVGLLWTSDQPDTETSTWQHKTTQETNIHASGGIRTHNPSKRAIVDTRFLPRGHWDRRCIFSSAIKKTPWNDFFSFSNFGIHVFISKPAFRELRSCVYRVLFTVGNFLYEITSNLKQNFFIMYENGKKNNKGMGIKINPVVNK
jgi:hypothetical protein